MLIPHRQLSPEALQGLIEEFVTRDGTDYGEMEIPLATKIDQIRRQLDQGALMIHFGEQDGGVTIVGKDQVPSRLDAHDSD